MPRVGFLGMGKVSVVIPCFRCAGTIGRTVASALAQSEPPLEVLIVDDASSDGTARALEELRQTFGKRVRVITLPRNAGASVARNAAWDAARGEFVALLDSDDAWHPEKLAIQTGFMRAHPEFRMTAHRHAFMKTPAMGRPNEEQVPYTEIRFRSLLYRNWFHTSSVMLRRDLPQRFDPAKRYGEDRQLWLDVVTNGGRVARIDLELVTIYKPLYGVSGLSSHLWEMEAAELATFRGLRRSGAVGTPLMCGLLAWSFARFLRRLLIVGLRRAWRST